MLNVNGLCLVLVLMVQFSLGILILFLVTILQSKRLKAKIKNKTKIQNLCVWTKRKKNTLSIFRRERLGLLVTSFFVWSI